MQTSRIGAIAAIAMGVTASFAGADVVTIGASRDNTLYEDPTGSLSNGNGDYLFVGRVGPLGGERIRRAVLAFDIAGHVPQGATINSVRLTLHMSRTIAPEVPAILHRLAADWGEGASNAGSEGGDGAPSAAGDATWIHRFFDTDAWTTPGGDYAPMKSASALIVGVGSYVWYAPEMAADVQAWLDQPSNNHGWILIGDESFGMTAKRFDSREINDPDLRPALEIDFTFVPPLVSTASNWSAALVVAMLATALIVGAGGRDSATRDSADQ